MHIAGRLFLISAPSAGGKTSLTHAVITQLQPVHPIKRVITYTSRAPRAGELDGTDYHFVSHNQFERSIKEGFFLEWSTAYGAYYGSPATLIDEVRGGASYALIVDRAGLQEIKSKMPEAISIWIWSSETALKERIAGRKSESDEQIERRLRLALQEGEAERTDPLCKHALINEDFHTAVSDLAALFKSYL